MKSKVAFIAFSDIQIEDWKRYSEDHSRLNHTKKIIRRVVGLCKKYEVPAIFCGDMFDNPKYLTNLVLNKSFQWLRHFFANGVEVFCIPGNHDQSEKQTAKHISPNYIDLLSLVYSNFYNVDGNTKPWLGKYTLSGIGYLTNNEGFMDLLTQVHLGTKKYPRRKHILLIHRDLPGAKDTNGRQAEPEDPKLLKYLKTFDLVLCGHIHKPQKLRSNILMLGATHQQRISDAGTKMGCWKIYEDLTWRFIPLHMPEFVFDEKKKEGNYFVEKPIVMKDLPEDVKVFNSNNPAKLARAYMKAKKINSKPKRLLLEKYLSD